MRLGSPAARRRCAPSPRRAAATPWRPPPTRSRTTRRHDGYGGAELTAVDRFVFLDQQQKLRGGGHMWVSGGG
eukprot:201255-Chlamydomonas_euryale.AAC.2